MFEFIVVGGVLVLFFILAIGILLAKSYKLCPNNRILVVYGRQNTPGAGPRCIHGGAAFVLPLLQDYAYLSLEPIHLTISPPSRLLPGSWQAEIPQAYTVAIGTTAPLMHNAAIRLLGLTESEIAQHAQELVLDALTEVAESSVEDLPTDDFYSRLEASLAAKLQTAGLELVSYRRE
jgi:flotillin